MCRSAIRSIREEYQIAHDRAVRFFAVDLMDVINPGTVEVKLHLLALAKMEWFTAI